MAKSYSSFCFYALLISLVLLSNGFNIGATRVLENQNQVPSWCLAKKELSDVELQNAIDYFCYQPRVDCNIIKFGGTCFYPDTKFDHASWSINEFVHVTSQPCPGNVGQVTTQDPSHGGCIYPLS